mgnify:CR=1 FL=1
METKYRVENNGNGRIGRLNFRRIRKNHKIRIVGINDLSDGPTIAHLLKYDSVHGGYPEDIQLSENQLKVGSESIALFQEKDPSNLPWKELEVDLVIESSGIFLTAETAGKRLQAGAAKVILSAPAKDDSKTVVIGVNENEILAEDRIVSNASCTTNCLAPMVKVLDDNFGLEKGYISTIHAYTGDQRILDAPHRDLRRARAAALSIIPTSTGAASAVGKVLPELKGKLDGIAMRVPVPDGSVTDLTAILKKEVSVEEVNKCFEEAAKGPLKGIMQYTSDPLVSADIVGNSHSCIIDSQLSSANQNLVKLVAWYDNEYGYSCRTAELAEIMLSL